MDKVVKLYKVVYDKNGKPTPLAVPVRSTGKGRLYVTDKRINGCKDEDYVLCTSAPGEPLALASVLFSTTAEEALAHWLQTARRETQRSRALLAVYEQAFDQLGLDPDGRDPATVKAPAKKAGAAQAKKAAAPRKAKA